MSDIDVSSGGGGHKKGPGVKKAKKLSTRVDMTPMVDLGFLLITFFIFTTTMSTPSTMRLTMPKDDPTNKTEIKESSALTIMIGKGGIYYYEGQLKPDGSNFKSATMAELRKEIIDKKKDVISRYVYEPTDDKLIESAKNRNEPDWQNAAKDRDFVVVIKPNKEASYGKIVDVLDEMTINHVQRFALVDITDNENELVKITEHNGTK